MNARRNPPDGFDSTLSFEPLRAPSSNATGSVRAIGSIMSDIRHLTPEQVRTVLEWQREKGVRFGEAAIALGFVEPEDVLAALADQFGYPYATPERWERNPELVTLIQPFSAQSEVFRGIRSQITMRTGRQGEAKRALAVLSPDSQDGKTYFAANLAVALAQLGGRTLLVDADLRVPRLHQVFDCANHLGLSSILAGRREGQVFRQAAGMNSLVLLTAGPVPPNPTELLERPGFSILMNALVAKFDHVVVDTPAASRGADASIIASRCGSALVLARHNETRLNALQGLVNSLDGSTTRLVGTVLNQY